MEHGKRLGAIWAIQICASRGPSPLRRLSVVLRVYVRTGCSSLSAPVEICAGKDRVLGRGKMPLDIKVIVKVNYIAYRAHRAKLIDCELNRIYLCYLMLCPGISIKTCHVGVLITLAGVRRELEVVGLVAEYLEASDFDDQHSSGKNRTMTAEFSRSLGSATAGDPDTLMTCHIDSMRDALNSRAVSTSTTCLLKLSALCTPFGGLVRWNTIFFPPDLRCQRTEHDFYLANSRSGVIMCSIPTGYKGNSLLVPVAFHRHFREIPAHLERLASKMRKRVTGDAEERETEDAALDHTRRNGPRAGTGRRKGSIVSRLTHIQDLNPQYPASKPLSNHSSYQVSVNSKPMRMIELNMERRRNERGVNGTSPRKPIDQRHSPARFPHAKVRAGAQAPGTDSLVCNLPVGGGGRGTVVRWLDYLGGVAPGSSYVRIVSDDAAAQGRGGVVVRLLASHLGESGSISGGVAPDFHMWESCRDDGAGRRVFFGDLPFPPPLHFGYAPYLTPLHTHWLSRPRCLAAAGAAQGLNSQAAGAWLDA
ncbi:hypothetical protein PR048_028933 [Dryococelus australis]|uniref:Uncharacterized protein n=1 Tax=Dryococelus australis TaxID=614101 RepID=A0ABQ9GEK5_9NEOP|nr:hypothetical protein PR048_028933 [Dryococelus australis]